MKRIRIWQCLRLPLRLRVALWSGLLMLFITFGLLFFINSMALSSFPNIVAVGSLKLQIQATSTNQLPRTPPPLLEGPFVKAPLNPITNALLFELQDISLLGMGLVTALGGIGAYILAGVALRPVRKVSASVRGISASNLHTRLALDGPQDEVRELADTFDTMLGRLERTFELQSNFIGDVAHELRTPLTALRTTLEVVSTDQTATLEDYRQMAAAQERALIRLERLIADLLLLARGEQPLQQAAVELTPLLQEVFCDLEHTARTRAIDLQLQSEREVIVSGDALLLTRVFSNLIENGIHYNQAGGSVTAVVDSQDNQAIVSISDSGVGIAPEKQAAIFERFYRIDASRARHTGGSGLGLSIVQTIVQQHGGSVTVQSQPRRGSTFTVSLPHSEISTGI